MDVNNLVIFNHDVFYGYCAAYDMLMLLVSIKSNCLYATSELLLYNSTRWLHV